MFKSKYIILISDDLQLATTVKISGVRSPRLSKYISVVIFICGSDTVLYSN